MLNHRHTGMNRPEPHQGLSLIVGDPVRWRIDDELDCADGQLSREPRLGDPVPAVHQGTIGGQDDGEPQIRRLDPTRVIGDLTTGRCPTAEPAVLIELGDIVDRDLPDRELKGQCPQPVGPEVMPAPVDEMGMMLTIHLGRLTRGEFPTTGTVPG